jgi:hypothetical protein
MAEEKEYIKAKNWALLDIEYIQCTRTHKCVRKLYMLAKDGYTDLLLEFFPCEPLHKLDEKYGKAFRYCQRKIHKLPYYPPPPSPPCWTAVRELNNFIVDNDIELVFYKGGEIEKNLCKELDIYAFDIDKFDLDKVYSHDPYVEMNCYYSQLIEM